MIIPEHERSAEPLIGENVIKHPDMVRAVEWVLTEYEPPKREICIFVPCSKAKPYHESPSHKMFDSIIFRHLTHDQVHVVVFGTCGVTPRELDTEYPFMDYQFMLGRCDVPKVKREFHKLESRRLARYLELTKQHYRHRIAYCLGDFRLAMEKAVELSQVKVDIVPKPGTMEKLHNPDLKFSFGSLYHQEYQRDFDEAICRAAGLDTSNDAITDIRGTSDDAVTDIRATSDDAVTNIRGTSDDAVTDIRATSDDAVTDIQTTSDDEVTDIRRTNVRVTDDSDWYII
ncbi:MAG: queuine tRNA-ribosyltransferase containing PUA domain protein [Methanosarcinales archaeon]|nr:queuine tRNA-ribosyltransferase containing PUA domain protein [Methanosarcinales archaeon]